MLTGLILILFAGLCQGTMGLGQKRFHPLTWEAYWLIFSILSMLVVPFIWQSLVIPDPFEAILQVPFNKAIIAISMGALWGIGALMWAKALVYIGLSITYGIGMSVSAMIGSLGLLFAMEEPFKHQSSYYIVLGIFIMVIGVAIVTLAGVKREKLKGVMPNTKSLSKGMIFLAFAFAFLNGIFSGGLNLGFVSVKAAAEAAIKQGAKPWNASLVQWQFVFFGGVIIQAGYAIFLLFKNKTFSSYRVAGAWKAYLTCIVTSFLWFAALGIYGQASAIMGEQGPVIGWSMYLSLALIVSNTWGIISGEWKNMRKPLKILSLGNVILLISWFILGYANSLVDI